MTPDGESKMQSSPSLAESLAEAVIAATDANGGRWLSEAIGRVDTCLDPTADLPILSARARRAVGQSTLDAHGPVLHTSDGPIRTEAWDVGAAARVVLALKVVARAADVRQSVGAIQTLYRSGDESEKVAVVRALSAFGSGDALKPIALDAGRTNSVVLFAALALNNPFPAAHYTEHEFNQLVLKAVFVEVPVQHVFGLEDRTNPSLSRMCEDYVDERTAAGRGFPPGLWLALAPHAGERAVDVLFKAVVDGDPDHRELASAAMARRCATDMTLRRAIQHRADAAVDEHVRTAYINVLSAVPAPSLSR